MGAEQSKSADHVFSNTSSIPVSFSPDLVNHLEDNLSSSGPSADRQNTLDTHVRARIQSELSRLRDEEEAVRLQIEAALEKENLDREAALAGEGEDGEGTASSAALQGDLEEVQKRVERFNERRKLDDHPEVKTAREAVVDCYRSNATTPLNCVDDVAKFKQSVALVEKKFVDSLL